MANAFSAPAENLMLAMGTLGKSMSSAGTHDRFTSHSEFKGKNITLGYMDEVLALPEQRRDKSAAIERAERMIAGVQKGTEHSIVYEQLSDDEYDHLIKGSVVYDYKTPPQLQHGPPKTPFAKRNKR